MLLRTDIINKLQKYDSNLNKVVTSNGVDLYWLISDKKAPEQHPLMKLIIHKARTSCSKLEGYKDREVYTKLFPEKIDNKEPLQYLLDLSFGRPRDFILYLNQVIKNCPESTCFNASAMKTVMAVYSSILFNELNNQLLFHKKPEYTEECFKLLHEIGKPTFTYEEVMKCYTENPNLFVHIKDLNESLEFMYRNGIIGNVWDQEHSNPRKPQKYSKKHFYWAYRRDAPQSVDFKKNFTIHPGLRKSI